MLHRQAHQRNMRHTSSTSLATAMLLTECEISHFLIPLFNNVAFWMAEWMTLAESWNYKKWKTSKGLLGSVAPILIGRTADSASTNENLSRKSDVCSITSCKSDCHWLIPLTCYSVFLILVDKRDIGCPPHRIVFLTRAIPNDLHFCSLGLTVGLIINKFLLSPLPTITTVVTFHLLCNIFLWFFCELGSGNRASVPRITK